MVSTDSHPLEQGKDVLRNAELGEPQDALGLVESVVFADPISMEHPANLIHDVRRQRVEQRAMWSMSCFIKRYINRQDGITDSRVRIVYWTTT